MSTRLFQGRYCLTDGSPVEEAGCNGTCRIERVRRDRDLQEPTHPRDTVILEPRMVRHGGCTAMVDHDPELLLLDQTVRQDRAVHFKSLRSIETRRELFTAKLACLKTTGGLPMISPTSRLEV